MKTNITKNVKQKLKELIDEKGYWSEEVRIFIEQFEYITSQKLHTMAIAYDKYREGELTKC